MVDEFAQHVDDPNRKIDGARIGWSSSFDTQRRRGKKLDLGDGMMRRVSYRPFVPMHLWYDPAMIDRPGIAQKLSPSAEHENLAIAVNAKGGSAPLVTNTIADLHLNGDTQVFPRYTWEPVALLDGAFNLDALENSSDTVNGYRRVDNITDATLARYRASYGDAITKDDVFFDIYALLHHPAYHETYAADLSKRRAPRTCCRRWPRSRSCSVSERSAAELEERAGRRPIRCRLRPARTAPGSRRPAPRRRR